MTLRAVGVPRALPEDLDEERLLGFHSLEQVVRWAFNRPASSGLPVPELDVVVQDEFTHDVVLALEGDLWLVFDST